MSTFRLLDLKQGQNKEGKTVLYLVFEYMDTDLKKYIRGFRQAGGVPPSDAVKVNHDVACSVKVSSLLFKGAIFELMCNNCLLPRF